MKLLLFVKHVVFTFMIYSIMHMVVIVVYILDIVVGWYLERGHPLEAVVEAVDEVELSVSMSLSVEDLFREIMLVCIR